MPNKLPVKEFLTKSERFLVVDVRTPAEFEKGHIIGAVNLPIFSNDERAVVGTIYKKYGKQKAVIKGLEYVGGKLASFSNEALSIAKENTILLYCWRGGMRSSSMAWLFNTVGIKTFTLEGGYKAYRNHVRNTINKIKYLVVLGGYTGSGKTELLSELQKAGEQILDLEGLAHHKGSSFGRLGEYIEQPTTEHFAHILYENIKNFDFNQRIWIEDESKRIGKIHIPDELFQKMRKANLIKIEIEKRIRIERLLVDYGKFKTEKIIAGIKRVEKRLGYDKAKQAVEDVENGDLKSAISSCLTYYDKAYSYGLSKREESKIHKLKINSDINESVKQIIALADKIQKS